MQFAWKKLLFLETIIYLFIKAYLRYLIFLCYFLKYVLQFYEEVLGSRIYFRWLDFIWFQGWPVGKFYRDFFSSILWFPVLLWVIIQGDQDFSDAGLLNGDWDYSISFTNRYMVVKIGEVVDYKFQMFHKQYTDGMRTELLVRKNCEQFATLFDWRLWFMNEIRSDFHSFYWWIWIHHLLLEFLSSWHLCMNKVFEELVHLSRTRKYQLLNLHIIAGAIIKRSSWISPSYTHTHPSAFSACVAEFCLIL